MCTFIWHIIHTFEIMLVDTGVFWTGPIFNFLLDLVKLYYLARKMGGKSQLFIFDTFGFSINRLVLDYVLITNFQVHLGAKLVLTLVLTYMAKNVQKNKLSASKIRIFFVNFHIFSKHFLNLKYGCCFKKIPQPSIVHSRKSTLPGRTTNPLGFSDLPTAPLNPKTCNVWETKLVICVCKLNVQFRAVGRSEIRGCR